MADLGRTLSATAFNRLLNTIPLTHTKSLRIATVKDNIGPDYKVGWPPPNPGNRDPSPTLRLQLQPQAPSPNPQPPTPNPHPKPRF